MDANDRKTVPPRACPSGHINPPEYRFCGACGTAIYPGAPPTWSTLPEAWRVVTHRRHLRTSLITAVIVGTVLFVINQLDVVLAGDGDVGVAIKSALTYIVPFCVTNVGILAATRQRGER